MNNIINERIVSYQNDLHHSYMVFKMLPEDEIIEYQIRMIQENPTGQLLSLHKKRIDNDIYFFFDITSKTSLNQLLKHMKINKHKFLSILKSLIRSIGLGRQYLLQGGSFILNGDHIYIDPASLELSIAYLPIEAVTDLNQDVKALLMELLIYKTSFESPAEGEFVYELLSMIKSESFSLNQLDKAIFNIALQEEQRNNLISAPKQDKVQKGSEPREANIKFKSNLNYFILVLSQLFFATVAVLISRYLYFQTEKFEASTLIGIATILIALDILTIWLIRVKYKFVSIEESLIKKTEKLNKQLTPRKHRGRNKNNRYGGAQSTGLKEYVDVQVYMDPKDFETSVMLEETPKLACLIGCGDNSQEKIFIDKSSFIIGRVKSQSDYISLNGAVGKLHAEITNKEGTFFMKDLNSRNGTFINGERIVSNVEHSIQNNDRIAFANSEYKFLWN